MQEDKKKTINNVDFYYDETTFIMTEQLIEELYNFTKNCRDKAYSISKDEDGLIIW